VRKERRDRGNKDRADGELAAPDGASHLYRGEARHGPNDSTFIPGYLFTRYKCEDDTFVSGGATTR
jgi:hypothetical protein